MLALALSAVGLVAFERAALWWLSPLAYIALVTALLVVSLEPVSAAGGAVPTLVGLPLDRTARRQEEDMITSVSRSGEPIAPG